MNKIAFVFPGQGSQKAGMGADFYENCAAARELYDQASELLSLDMASLCFEKNDLLDQGEYTQPALVTTCLAMTRAIKERDLTPQVTAGLSLGEYAAIAVSGGMSEEDAIRTVRKRGILMQNAVPRGQGTMAAVLGMSAADIEKTIADIRDVSIANYNCPGQIVITGLTEAVEQAKEALLKGGARRVLPLNVSGPFHSPFLREAGDKLAQELDQISIRTLEIPYVTNVTASYIKDSADIKRLLAKQVYSPVLWEQSAKTMIDHGIDIFVEIGPGRSLTGFLKKIDQTVRLYNIASWEDVDRVVQSIEREA